MPDEQPTALSTLEYHLLLALARGPLHGYAITDAVASESAQTVTPRAGSLYRVVARLMTRGFVGEAEAPADAPPHPGLSRRYYALTSAGRSALLGETRRLKQAAALAEERLGTADGHP